MKKELIKTDALKEEIDMDVAQNPDIDFIKPDLKSKRRRPKRDGCGGGGGGGVVGGIGGSFGFSPAGVLLLLAGDSPILPGVPVVKAAHDIMPGTKLKEKDVEDVKKKDYEESRNKTMRDMLTRPIALNRSTTRMIPKGTILRRDMVN